jgi:hypothetical protein
MLPIESTSEKRLSKLSGFKGACVGMMVAAAALVAVFSGRPGASAQQVGNRGGGAALLGNFEIYTDNQVGSTGSVDESDVSKIQFSGARAILKAGAGNSSAVIRFSIHPGVSVDNLQLAQTTLSIRYKDNGSGAQVVAKLKAWQDNGDGEGTTTTLLTVDSNHNTQLPTLQRFGVFDSSGNIDFDIFTVYYVEATLTRTNSNGTPELGAIEVTMMP